MFTKFKRKHLCLILLFNKAAVARFTGDKPNTVVHDPIWAVT